MFGLKLKEFFTRLSYSEPTTSSGWKIKFYKLAL